MANETQLNLTLSNNKSGVFISGTVGLSITMAGTNSISSVQNIGTATEVLVIGDVTTIGYLMVKNLDTTNYVELDLNTPVAGTAFCKLLPGEACIIPTRQTVIYAKANTAACDCLVLAIEL